MIILGIETSCDETAMTVLKIKNGKNPVFSILSNIVSSQIELHQKYGGVYPFLAKREHQKNLPLVFKQALQKAKTPISKIDLIAITSGPGLEPCLWTGVNFGKEITEKNNLPIVAVNHIEAHILINWLQSTDKKNQFKKIKINFPAVCLVVSGGHSQLVLIEKFKKYKIIGETRDDAAGECFDKTARILGLGYPGGPKIAAEASKFSDSDNRFSIKLPRPMIYQKNYDFSFSGLKTSVLYDFKKRKLSEKKSKKYIQAMSKEIEQAIIDVLIHKTIKAAKDNNAKTIMLAGGVSANKELGRQFKKAVQKKSEKTCFLKPNIEFSTDNAFMVAVAGYFNKNKKTSWKKVKVNANLKI